MKIRRFVSILTFSVIVTCNAIYAGASIYSSKQVWKDEQGQNFELGSFKGKWVLISMMYTTCSSSCPMIVQKMRKLETALEERGFKPDFVLVTFDSERDTPEKLKAYRKKIDVAEKNWHFLNGTSADTRRLSMLLGIKYAKDPESGEFMHDNKILLISPEGEIVARLNSLGDSQSEILEKIQKKH